MLSWIRAIWWADVAAELGRLRSHLLSRMASRIKTWLVGVVVDACPVHVELLRLGTEDCELCGRVFSTKHRSEITGAYRWRLVVPSALGRDLADIAYLAILIMCPRAWYSIESVIFAGPRILWCIVLFVRIINETTALVSSWSFPTMASEPVKLHLCVHVLCS